jgi:hypothetical protein
MYFIPTITKSQKSKLQEKVHQEYENYGMMNF